MNARLIFVHALSPLHPGVGQGLGVIDLPVAREKATGLPFLPGSSLKGTLRDACAEDKTAQVLVFGPDTTSADAHAGAVQFSDQRLLLLPIRSLAGTFAWVTAPYILRRFAREARETAVSNLPTSIPQPAAPAQCCVAESGCAITVGQQVCLEDLDLSSIPDRAATLWAEWLAGQLFSGDRDWQQMLNARFCVVHDDVLSFLLETATEVIARVKLLEDAKTVQTGGLWYEEALPTETVLAGLVVATPVKGASVADVFRTLKKLAPRTIQLGGKATVGRGLCRISMTD